MRLAIAVLPFYLVLGALVSVPVIQRHQQLQRVSAYVAAVEERSQQSPARPTLLAPVYMEGKPARIVIPSVGIDLKVVDGAVSPQLGTWIISPTDANYALGTTLLNNISGKTLIYGHANARVLDNTKHLTLGAVVYVTADNGKVFEYHFASKAVVEPSDTTILSSLSGAPGLVLLTCDGTWFEHRRIMYFDFVSVT